MDAFDGSDSEQEPGSERRNDAPSDESDGHLPELDGSSSDDEDWQEQDHDRSDDSCDDDSEAGGEGGHPRPSATPRV